METTKKKKKQEDEKEAGAKKKYDFWFRFLCFSKYNIKAPLKCLMARLSFAGGSS